MNFSLDEFSLKTKVTEAMTKSGFPVTEAFEVAREIKQLLKLSFWQFVGLSFKMMRSDKGSPLWVQARQAAGTRRHVKAIYEGDEKEGILFAGECCGAINEVLSVKEIINRVIAEAEETLEATRKKIAKAEKV